MVSRERPIREATAAWRSLRLCPCRPSWRWRSGAMRAGYASWASRTAVPGYPSCCPKADRRFRMKRILRCRNQRRAQLRDPRCCLRRCCAREAWRLYHFYPRTSEMPDPRRCLCRCHVCKDCRLYHPYPRSFQMPDEACCVRGLSGRPKRRPICAFAETEVQPASLSARPGISLVSPGAAHGRAGCIGVRL